MINEIMTYEKFGYSNTHLSHSSHKKICVICDYCEDNYVTTKKNRETGFIKFPKDACNNCKYKKRGDVTFLKYGVANSAQRPEVRKKLKESTTFGTKEFERKKSRTMLERYGVEHSMQNSEILEKTKKVFLDKYGVDNPMKSRRISKVASERSVETKVNNGTIQSLNGQTLPDMAKDKGVSRSHFGKWVRTHGLETALSMNPRISSLEQKFTSWCDAVDIPYEKQYRVDNKIADVKIDNLLIELDGLYWHSEKHLDKFYHQEKMNVYKDAVLTPLFFREHEICDKFEIVKSIVLNKLGRNHRVFARKCKIKEVPKEDAKLFFNSNHLMGAGRGVPIGLYFNDELVSCMQLCRINNNNWDISRFCHKLNTSVVGAFSKILSNFVNLYSPKSIRTFIDMRYGDGQYLTRMGFTLESNHLSFKWTDGKTTFNRMKFPGRSGYNEGLIKIWDCGQAKYLRLF